MGDVHMARTGHSTKIKSADFEAFVSEVAAAIWNQLAEKPDFNDLRFRDFPSIFEVVKHTLHPYREPKLLKDGNRDEK